MNNKASITALMSSFGRAFHAENELDTCADCPQMDGCPTLGSIVANSPFVLDNLNWLRETTEKGSLKDE